MTVIVDVHDATLTVKPDNLDVKVKRPWVGRVRCLQIEAKAWLSDQRLGTIDPATQLLRLKVFPIVPTWLLLVVLALLSALLAVILHTNQVHRTYVAS